MIAFDATAHKQANAVQHILVSVRTALNFLYSVS